MLGVIDGDSDAGSRGCSHQSSVFSQWEDRIMSGDEEGGSLSRGVTLPSVSQAAKDAEFHFHDISKAIPDNMRHQNAIS